MKNEPGLSSWDVIALIATLIAVIAYLVDPDFLSKLCDPIVSRLSELLGVSTMYGGLIFVVTSRVLIEIIYRLVRRILRDHGKSPGVITAVAASPDRLSPRPKAQPHRDIDSLPGVSMGRMKFTSKRKDQS